jgi:branched-subunit amino acid transport protein
VALEVYNGIGCMEITLTQRAMGLHNEDKMILRPWHTQLVQYLNPSIMNGVIQKGNSIDECELLQSCPNLVEPWIGCIHFLPSVIGCATNL